MATHMSKYIRVGMLCLLTSFLSYQAYGCTLDGIDIQKMLALFVQQSAGVAKAKSSTSQKSGVIGTIDLAKTLRDSKCLETIVAQVQVHLSADVENECFPDTDEEKEEMKEKKKKAEARKPIGLAAIGNKSKNKCLLRQENWKYSNDSSKRNTAQLCDNLALDAYEIANVVGEGKDNTCLCVLLRDNKNHAHKIVFHNSKGQLAPTMRSKASDLSYTVRNIRKGHAEAQFVSFLLKRMEQPNLPLQYHHILGMGCSRKNCPNCARLLKFFLGNQYVDFHAYASEEKIIRKEIQMVRKETNGKIKIVKTTPERIDHIETVYPGYETGSYPKNDYLLPENIREVLEAKLGRSLYAN